MTSGTIPKSAAIPFKTSSTGSSLGMSSFLGHLLLCFRACLNRSANSPASCPGSSDKSLGPDSPDAEEREMPALLGAGEGAVPSHLSAARRLSLDVPRDPMVHVTIRVGREVRVLVGVRVWRSRD